MAGKTRFVTWKGKDLPPEFCDLSAGRYVVEAFDDVGPALLPDEEAGIEAALESYRKGRAVGRGAPAKLSTPPSGVEGHIGS